MTLDQLTVTFIGTASIVAIYWFFFGKKEEDIAASDTWTITVEGGYKPATITIPRDKPVGITFLRKDPNTCLEEVVFPDYKIKEYLPLNKPVTITLPPPHPGKSGSPRSGGAGFHCGMNMYHGKIVVAG